MRAVQSGYCKNYRKQVDWLKKHFDDLGEDPMVDDATKSNQEALSVLRFALQIVSVLSEKGPEEADEIVAFAEGVGMLRILPATGA